MTPNPLEKAGRRSGRLLKMTSLEQKHKMLSKRKKKEENVSQRENGRGRN